MMNNLRIKLNRIMMGRYGHDKLNSFLLYSALALNLFGIFVKSSIPAWIALVCLIVLNIRFFSRNLVKRYAENQKFLNLTRRPRHFCKAAVLSAKDREHRYVLCSHCHQILRLPKGKGTLEVTCPACRTTFEKRT